MCPSLCQPFIDSLLWPFGVGIVREPFLSGGSCLSRPQTQKAGVQARSSRQGGDYFEAEG